jgi:hypothetical protein
MIPIATPTIGNQQHFYHKPIKIVTQKMPQDDVEHLTDEEKLLKDIAFFTQYMEDLKAGRYVDNISPDDDPYFLVPENIDSLIRGLEDVLAGRVIEIKDPKNIWASLDIE